MIVLEFKTEEFAELRDLDSRDLVAPAREKYTVIAVLDELSRQLPRGHEAQIEDLPTKRLVRGDLVAPRWYVHAFVYEGDVAHVYWAQNATVWRDGAWRLVMLRDGGWEVGLRLAGIRASGAEYNFDLRTGVLRLVEAEESTWTNRRVYPSRADTRLFAAWLRQWLPDRGPVKNPKRSRR